MFDAWGNKLYDAGSIIQTQEELNIVIEDGYFDTSPDQKSKNEQLQLPKATQANGFSQPSPKPDTQSAALLPTINSTNINNTELNKESVMLDLDTVRWHVGETFFLQVHDNPAIRYTVKLIGYVKNQSILVTTPKIDAEGRLFEMDKPLLFVRFQERKLTHLPHQRSNRCTHHTPICTCLILK